MQTQAQGILASVGTSTKNVRTIRYACVFEHIATILVYFICLHLWHTDESTSENTESAKQLCPISLWVTCGTGFFKT